MTDDEIIAVVQAHKEGKKIQFRDYRSAGIIYWPKWTDCALTGRAPGWDFRGTEYRVAPEPRKPREFWMLRIGRAWRLQNHVEDNPQMVSERIKVREVLENE